MNNFIDQPVHRDLFSKGYDAFGQSPLTFENYEVNSKAKSMLEAGVPSNFIQDGDTIVRLNVVDGFLQSDGFISGQEGWRIDSDGNAEFESGYFRGSISGASGVFGGVSINETPETIIVNDGTNDRVLIGKLEGKF